MKKLIGFAFALILFSNTIFAQVSDSSETQNTVVSKNSWSLFQQGKLDEAIAAAEKKVEAEKSLNSADTTSYANALVNLAQLKQDYFFIYRELFRNKKNSFQDIRSAPEKMQKNAKNADENFRLALRLNENGGRAETPQTADIKINLALLIYNYIGSRESIDESEKLFTEALALN